MKSFKKEKTQNKNIRDVKSPLLPDNNLNTFFYSFLFLLFFHFLINWLFQNKSTQLIIARSWGMNNFSYYTWWMQVVFYTGLVMIAWPVINEKIFSLYQQTNFLFNKNKKPKIVFRLSLFFFISMAVAFLLYWYRVQYDLLGDMNLRVLQTLQQGYIKEEYFTMYLLYQLYDLLYSQFHLNGHQVFVLHSILCGFIFCFFSLLTSDLINAHINSKLFSFLFYLSMGTMLLFCGYVEIYAIPALFTLIYLYVSLLFLHERMKLITVFIVLVLAISFHAMLISLIPSFLFLVLKKHKMTDRIHTKHIVLTSFVSIFLIYIVNNYFSIASLTPLVQVRRSTGIITLFSFSHLLEFFNSQLLSSNLNVFLTIFILIQLHRNKIRLDTISKFLLTASGFMMIVVFTANKMRGSGDWDICSFPSIPLSLFVIYTILHLFKNIYSEKKLFYLMSVAFSFNFINTAAWVEINASPKSINKIADMLCGDPASYYKTLPAELGLARNFELQGLPEEAIRWHETSYKKYGYKDPNASFIYAIALESLKRDGEAMKVLENMIQSFPTYVTAYQRLYSIYDKKKLSDKKYKLSIAFAGIFDQNPRAFSKAAGKDFLLKMFGSAYQVSSAQQDSITGKSMMARMNQLNSF